MELSVNLTEAMVSDIAMLAEDKQIEIISLHNFCPIPNGIERKLALPDYYSLASPNDEERNLALKFTKQTIDTARKLNAKAVVLHAGRIEIPDKTRDLMALFSAGEVSVKKFHNLKESIKRERAKNVKPYFESVISSLSELCHHAAEKGIKIGMENRYYFREIPSFEEIEIILDKFRKENLFYWHDVGHAQVWENLGFQLAESFLKKYSGRLLGVHLHDVYKTDDHRAPLQGDVDFSRIAPF